MKLDKDDEHYKLIYEWVDELDFIEGYHFLKAKQDGTEAFTHLHMELKNAGGDITLRIDANGVMITCGCGCMSSEELDYFEVCKIQKDLDKMITSSENNTLFDGMYPPSAGWSRNDEAIGELWDQFKNINRDSEERRIDRDMKRLNQSIDRIFDKIERLDIEKREQYLVKLKEVLGKSD